MREPPHLHRHRASPAVTPRISAARHVSPKADECFPRPTVAGLTMPMVSDRRHDAHSLDPWVHLRLRVEKFASTDRCWSEHPP